MSGLKLLPGTGPGVCKVGPEIVCRTAEGILRRWTFVNVLKVLWFSIREPRAARYCQKERITFTGASLSQEWQLLCGTKELFRGGESILVPTDKVKATIWVASFHLLDECSPQWTIFATCS